MTANEGSDPAAKGVDTQFLELVQSWQGRAASVDAEVAARHCDEFADKFSAVVEDFTVIAAWARLLGAQWRNEADLPDSIHATDDEDPADTARWQKWRVT